MNRANRALRRSSIKLKCLNSGHADLNIILSDIKELRSSFKSFYSAQIATWEDMAKWANKEKNIALQETLQFLFEISNLWSEVQLDFIAGLKKFKHQFQLILESELLLDKSKSHLAACEQKDIKIRKEIKKMATKGSADEVKNLSERQVESEAQIKAAQFEVSTKSVENEAVKLMLTKEGLLNISLCYLEMFEKAIIIFKAHKEITKCLPDVHDKEISDIRYQGPAVAKSIVQQTKECVHCHNMEANKGNAPPPPYSPSSSLSTENAQNYSFGYHQSSHDSHQPAETIRPYAEYPPVYDLPPAEMDENLEGAVGGIRISENTSSNRYMNI